MDAELNRLIEDFHKTVRAALKVISSTGIKMPHSSIDWLNTDTSAHKTLANGIQYQKHGAGIAVYLNAGKIDFDFGEQGEINSIDSWRLSKFVVDRPSLYAFRSEGEITKHLEDSVEKGLLSRTRYGIYYRTDQPRQYAAEMDFREPTDKLPSRDLDPILTLHSHYFLTAELMLKNHEKLRAQQRTKGHLSQNAQIDSRIYFTTWLGFLAVTCEALQNLKLRKVLELERPESFQELIPISDAIGKQMKKNADSLRKFRNTVFHLRSDLDAARNFFDRSAQRVLWAQQLHENIAKFMSMYRIFCEEHYYLNDRLSESELANRTKRKRSKAKSIE